jgi:hypothetical protein
MTKLLLLVPVLLAGCSWLEPSLPPLPPPASEAEAQCRAHADDDPAVKAIIVRNAGNLHLQAADQNELEVERRRAIARCLQARGLAPRGGVERLQKN